MAGVNEKIAKGFGARYGGRVRKKYAKMAAAQRNSYKCPYCSYVKVRRVAVGIWNCKNCDSKFTNKAYSVAKVASVKVIADE